LPPLTELVTESLSLYWKVALLSGSLSYVLA